MVPSLVDNPILLLLVGPSFLHRDFLLWQILQFSNKFLHRDFLLWQNLQVSQKFLHRDFPRPASRYKVLFMV
jgi:hypothetical protein